MIFHKVALAAVLAMLPIAAPAAVQVFNFSGAINSSSVNGVTDTLLGQTVSGQFSYDTSLLPDNYITSYGTQVGEFYTASTQVSFNTPLGTSTGTFNLINDHASGHPGQDQFTIVGNPSAGAIRIANFTAYIPARPLNAPLPTDLAGTGFSFLLIGDTSPAGYQTVLGGNVTINAPAVATVPEPASWAMMVGGFGLIGGALRRRQLVRVNFA